MVRAGFFSVGLFVLLWGTALLFVDEIVLSGGDHAARDSAFRGLFTGTTSKNQPVIDPPDWAAFSLLSIGSVTMLYSFALPKKGG
jgi:hypothetical protein